MISSLIKKHGFAFISLLLAGYYFITFNIFGEGMIFIPGDLGDARFNLYVLEHNFQFLFTDDLPTKGYWNAPFMYPQEAVLTFSDNLMGTALFYSFFRWLGADPYQSFQFWYLLILFLNYSCSYLFLYWLSRNTYSAALGAFVFTFSIALFGQLVHAQTYPRFPIALAFLFGCLYLKDLSPKYFFLTLLMVVYQFYCAIYLGFLSIIPVSVLLAFVLIQKRFYESLRNVKWLGMHLLSILISIASILPLMIPYFKSPLRKEETELMVGKYSYEAIFENIPSLRSFLFLDTKSLFWSFLSEQKGSFKYWWQHQLFPGILVYIAIAGLFIFLIWWFYKKRKLQLWQWGFIGSALLTFALYLKIGDFSLYKLIYQLPGFYSVRAVQRVINIELIFFATALCVAASFLLRNRLAPLLFMALSAFLLADNYVIPWTYPSYKIQTSIERVEELKRSMKDLPKASVVSYEPGFVEQIHLEHIDAMLAAQESSMISVNGYTSKCAQDYCKFFNRPNAKNRKEWFNSKGIQVEIKPVVRQK